MGTRGREVNQVSSKPSPIGNTHQQERDRRGRGKRDHRVPTDISYLNHAI